MNSKQARQKARDERDERQRQKAEREMAQYRETGKSRPFVKAYGRALRARSW